MTDQDTPEPETGKPDPVDDLVTTQHTLRTGRGSLAYTARTGRVVLGEEEVKEDVFLGWKARAEMSVTAYTLDDADVTTRPITFVFNGGPGSSSIWLHMGLLGPRRVDLGSAASDDQLGVRPVASQPPDRRARLLYRLVGDCAAVDDRHIAAA